MEKSKIHDLGISLRIGKNGITLTVLEEMDKYLKKHEYMKIKFLRAFIEENNKIEACDLICNKLRANNVDFRGNVLVIYRKKPKEETKKDNISKTTKKKDN